MHEMNHQKLVHHYLFDVAMESPQKMALVLDDQSLTYAELMVCVQRLALDMVSQGATPGQIICQFVERSVEMIVGMFSILTTGCAYCALNPADPPAQLITKIEELGSFRATSVLIHKLAREKFDTLTKSVQLSPFPIDEQLSKNFSIDDDDLARLSRIPITDSSSSYLVFTSGSTGKPKIVQHTHTSAITHIQSICDADLFRSSDQILQLASCSWVAHVLEVFSGMMTGATLVLLKPNGLLDLAYTTRTMKEKQVTGVTSSPTFSRTLIAYFKSTKSGNRCFATLRRFNTGGEYFSSRLLNHLFDARSNVVGEPLAWNLTKQLHALLPPQAMHHNAHGASECGIGIAYRVPEDSPNQTDTDSDQEMLVPAGKAVLGVTAYLVDEDLQLITAVGQVGELLYSGE